MGIASPPQQQAWAGISPDLQLEAEWLAEAGGSDAHITPLTPPVSLWRAEVASHRVLPGIGAGLSAPLLRKGLARRGWLLLCRLRAQQALAAWGQPSSRWPGEQVPAQSMLPDVGFPRKVDVAVELVRLLESRQLLSSELPTALGMAATEIIAALHWLVHLRLISSQAAVGIGPLGRYVCRRCGSQEVEASWCHRCGSECPFCLSCSSLGEARGCQALYGLHTSIKPYKKRVELPPPNLPFPLSPAQKEASTQLAAAVRRGAKELVVWAACGAGKTEVTYAAIRATLAAGGRVLLATPRRDVSSDLCCRLQQVFGEENVAGLWGGAPERYKDAPILVVTTHQNLRLAARFSLVILDECDAYPYAGTPMLRRAMARLASSGSFVQMTATPPPGLHRSASHGAVEVINIPARHHGYPLPVPELIVDKGCAAWQKSSGNSTTVPSLPATLLRLTQQGTQGGGQMLVFVPQKRLVEPVAKALAKALGKKVAGVHAQHPLRAEICRQLQQGELPVVVATTVFERGLTFPKVDVIVLCAEVEGVFDAATLVQMAGRVGRTTSRPTGNVFFVASRISKEMRQAVAAISALNEKARAQRLIRIDA